MGRMPIRHRLPASLPGGCPPKSARGIRPGFPGLSPCGGQVAYALRTRAPVAGTASLPPAAPRLACIKPAASVHPEPGSNSSWYLSSCLARRASRPRGLPRKPRREHALFSCSGPARANKALRPRAPPGCISALFNELPPGPPAAPAARLPGQGCKGTTFPRPGKAFPGFFFQTNRKSLGTRRLYRRPSAPPRPAAAKPGTYI